MENFPALVPITQVRDRVIQQLTDAFANDLITMDEFEGRLEQVYRAQSVAETEALVAGLPALVAAPSKQQTPARRGTIAVPGDVPIHDRFMSVFGSSSRRGVWSVPHQFDVVAVFADALIDLTTASLPGDLIDMNVKAYFANVRIVVPPGLRVVNRVGAFMANASSDSVLDLAPMIPGSPVIRISGVAVFANVEIVAESRPGESE